MESKRLIRIGIGQDHSGDCRAKRGAISGVSKPGSFNLVVTEAEHKFVRNLSERIKACSDGEPGLVISDLGHFP